MMEVVVTTGAIRCAKLQSSRHNQQTNTKPFYRPDPLPVVQPTVSRHGRELMLKVNKLNETPRKLLVKTVPYVPDSDNVCY